MNNRDKRAVKRIQIVLGLAVLSVFPFRSAMSQGLNKATLECKSESFRRTVCSAGASIEWIRLIEKKSDAACVEGSGFGFSGASIWVDKGCAAKFEVGFAPQSGRDRSSGSVYPSRQRNRSVRFACKSDQHRIGACYVAGSIVDLRLMEKKSRAACVKNSSFGFRDDAVWVKNGCEGEFEVTYRPNSNADWEFANGGPQTKSLICKSDQFRRATCKAGGVISEIRLKNKRSRAECKADSTYGFSFDEIWVTNGCEADFEVLYFPRR